MRVPADEVDAYLLWASVQWARPYTLHADLRMSLKIYEGELCSFTTTQPGKNRDDYWCNDAMMICAIILFVEVAMICKWVHRNFSSRFVVGDSSVQDENQSKLVFIFDGSSNHGARAMDALHVWVGALTGVQVGKMHQARRETKMDCQKWGTDGLPIRKHRCWQNR